MADLPGAESPGGFATAIKDLARNPLGIIAIFIVLVYAVAGFVVSKASNEFYNHPGNPAVWFMILFPTAVLFVFYKLVTEHPLSLYAPGDFRDDKSFLAFLNKDVSPPSALSRSTPDVNVSGGIDIAKFNSLAETLANERMFRTAAGEPTAAAESQTRETAGASTSPIAESDYEYKALIDAGVALLHGCKVIRIETPGSRGVFQVRIWLEPIEEGKSLDNIVAVSYNLWPDFNPRVVSTQSRADDFAVWLTCYGEFPVLATLLLKDGRQVKLQRFLDLPGRPKA